MTTIANMRLHLDSIVNYQILWIRCSYILMTNLYRSIYWFLRYLPNDGTHSLVRKCILSNWREIANKMFIVQKFFIRKYSATIDFSLMTTTFMVQIYPFYSYNIYLYLTAKITCVISKTGSLSTFERMGRQDFAMSLHHGPSKIPAPLLEYHEIDIHILF